MQEEPIVKTCSKCLNNFPATKNFFHSRRQGYLGLHSVCKSCRNNYAKIIRLKNPEKTKECQKKSREKHKEKRNLATRLWFKAHPGYSAARYRSNPKKFASKAREWRKNLSKEKAENLLHKNRIRCSIWRNSHHSKTWMREYFSKYRLKNANKLLSISRNYKSKKRNAAGYHSELDIFLILERQNRQCYWCDKVLTKFHMDHVVPISKNGSNDASNLVASCPHCNLSKGDRLPDEWPQNPRKNAHR